MRLTPLIIAIWALAQPAIAADKMSLLLDWFEITAPADPSAPPKMVAAGQADLAISYQPQQHLQVQEGMPLVRVGTLIGMPLNCLLVRADGPVQSIADLKGRKVGFSVSGVEEAILSHLLAQHEMTLDDIEMVNVNWSLAPALMSNQVDAVIGAVRDFQPNQMAAEDIPGRCFFLEEEGYPAYDELIYVANPDSMDREQLKRFLAATQKAAHFIVNQPEKAWEIFSATAPELSDELNRKAWFGTVARFSLSPAALDAGRYVAFEKFQVDAGLDPEITPLSSLAVDLGAQ